MRRFFIADVTVAGDLRALAEYRYEQLELIPGAAELIGTVSGAIWRQPLEFEVPLHEERTRLVLRWRASAATAGVATVWDGAELASVSLAWTRTSATCSTSCATLDTNRRSACCTCVSGRCWRR